jgi:hypothetical protein
MDYKALGGIVAANCSVAGARFVARERQRGGNGTAFGVDPSQRKV